MRLRDVSGADALAPAPGRLAAATLAAVATATPRSDASTTQDRAAAFSAPLVSRERRAERDHRRNNGVVAVTVADGVGSLPDSAFAAQAACDACSQLWSERPDRLISIAETAVPLAHRAVLETAPGLAATTVLSAAALDGEVLVEWVGNGTALVFTAPRVRSRSVVAAGARDDVAAALPDPLMAELMLPHISWQDGRDVLEEIIGGVTAPLVETIRLGRSGRERLVLIVTDGLATAEQREIGQTADGTQWRLLSMRDRALTAIAKALLGPPPQFAPGDDPDLASAQEPERWTSAALGAVLQASVDGLLTAGQLDDDATIGALLVPADPVLTRA